MKRPALLLLLATVGLAGCAADAGVIQFHGEGAGVDSSTILCEEGASKVSIGVTYKGDFGKKFNIQALTPVNKAAAFNETLTLPGPEEKIERFEIDAIQGAWELRVERLDPFKGNIEVIGGC